MGSAEYSADVLERMQNDPDVLFAVSEEIRDKILSAYPDLSDQLVDTGVSNYQFTHDVNENLNLLTDNLGIDVPDSLGKILPYIGEIILGIRLIWDIISVQRDFKSISTNDKAKLSAVKCIVLISRFGVSTFCIEVGALVGGSAGSGAPIVGNLTGGIAGGIGGALVSAKLNKYLKPYMMDIALRLTGLNKDDMFYFHNKEKINNIALSFVNTGA